MIFINTASYNEIIMKSSDFYNCLKEMCIEFIGRDPEQKDQVHLLMDKIKAILNLLKFHTELSKPINQKNEK